MNKNEQKEINEEVLETYNDLLQCIDYYGSRIVERLRSCNAVVWETKGYTYLVSYHTIVACIGHADNLCYDFLRHAYGYTTTSAQHIAKFIDDYLPHGLKRYYPV